MSAATCTGSCFVGEMFIHPDEPIHLNVQQSVQQAPRRRGRRPPSCDREALQELWGAVASVGVVRGATGIAAGPVLAATFVGGLQRAN